MRSQLRRFDKRLIISFALLLAPLTLGEVLLRTLNLQSESLKHFYHQQMPSICKSKYAVIAVGSSRVAAAFDPVVAEGALCSTKERPNVFNVASGGTTVIEHFLGLKQVANNRGSFDGVTVLIEAPGGLPDLSSWRSNWVSPGRPDIIVPYMTASDLVRMWTTSQDDNELKLFISLARMSALILQQQAIRSKIVNVIDATIERIFPRTTASEPAADLVTDGGIKNDANGVARARQFAVERAQQIGMDKKVKSLQNTVLEDIVRMVSKNGGNVVFFTMPVSSPFRTAYGTEQRKAEVKAFRQTAPAWNATIIDPQFSTTDADFPDYWHLSASNRAGFTRALCSALNAVKKNAESSGESPSSGTD